MQTTLYKLNSQATRIKLYIDGQLSDKFRLPVYVEDEVTRVIALSTLNRGSDMKLWLNGSQENLENLALELRVVYRRKSLKPSSEKPIEHVEG